MGEYLSPGVYVEEYDNSPRSIEGVGTSTAGFIGLAERGPVVGAPTLVTSFSSFTKQFGGFLSEFVFGEYRYLANSVEQFFMNGGTRCFIARVIPEDAKCAQAKKGILTLTAANEGKWGNKIQFTIGAVTKKKLQIVAKEGDAFKAKNADGFKEGDIVVCEGEYNRITAVFDDKITFAKPFKANIVDAEIIPKVVLYLVEYDAQVKYNDEVETYTGMNFNPSSADYIGVKMEKSDLVKVELAPSKTENPIAEIYGKDEPGLIVLAGGTDGSMTKVSAATFMGKDDGPGKRTGIASFVENTIVSMIAVPGITIPEVVVDLVGHCERLKSRFAVLDMPKDLTKTKDLIEYRGLIDSTYAAMYHPWIQVFDRATNKPGFVPPAGAIMGVYSRTDIERGVHKAPANETVACTGLKVNYTQGEQDILNPEGINLIRMLPGQGIRVWGARTASSNSAFKYVNVRRLFIYVEESIKANTNWVVFEPNDATLWSRVALTISSFLTNMWRSGMLAGSVPSEAFFVEIGTTTMSRDDIDNGRLICNIGIAPSKPAEFVIFRVTQHTAESGGGGEE